MLGEREKTNLKSMFVLGYARDRSVTSKFVKSPYSEKLKYVVITLTLKLRVPQSGYFFDRARVSFYAKKLFTLTHMIEAAVKRLLARFPVPQIICANHFYLLCLFCCARKEAVVKRLLS